MGCHDTNETPQKREPRTDPLPDDLLLDVAELRADGHSWEVTAAAVQWDATELKHAVRRDSRYPAALERARREKKDEAEAELVATLRELMESSDVEVVSQAAEQLANYLSAYRRDETRLAVERLKAETRLQAETLRAQNRSEKNRKRAGDAEKQRGDHEDSSDPSMLQHRLADDASRELCVVHLWGGCHKLPGCAPDDTDTPLFLYKEFSREGTRYWAVTDPLPVEDVRNGPFLAPPGIRPQVSMERVVAAEEMRESG